MRLDTRLYPARPVGPQYPEQALMTSGRLPLLRTDRFEKRSQKVSPNLRFGQDDNSTRVWQDYIPKTLGPYDLTKYDYAEAQQRNPDPEVSVYPMRGDISHHPNAIGDIAWREETYYPAPRPPRNYFTEMPDFLMGPARYNWSFLQASPSHCNFTSRDTEEHYTYLLAGRIGFEPFDRMVHNRETPPSPVAQKANSHWLKQAKIVGVPPAALGSFYNVVKYAMHSPDDAIHLKPLLDSGGMWHSVYAINSWAINQQYRDHVVMPSIFGRQTVEEQLKLSIDMLHGMGKTVGIDLPLHTTQHSDISLSNPDLFEWMKLSPDKAQQVTPMDPNTLHRDAESVIQQFLTEHGDPDGQPITPDVVAKLYSEDTPETDRVALLLGNDPAQKTARRSAIKQALEDAGLILYPVPHNTPHRPIQYDGMRYDPYSNLTRPHFKIPGHKQNQEPCFWDLTPYKLYEVLPDGTPDLRKPHWKTWNYLAGHVATLQKQFGFDFLRADMALLQHSRFPNATKAQRDPHEIWGYIKHEVQRRNQAPYFATLGETFYEGSYDDPKEFMDANDFDAALGYLHFIKVGTGEFLRKVRELNTQGKSHVPCMTVSTTDIDNPNEAHRRPAISLEYQIRLFMSYFLNSPGYTAMGGETQSVVPFQRREFSHSFLAAPNINDPLIPGVYKWGNDPIKDYRIRNIRRIYDTIGGELKTLNHYWLNGYNEQGYDDQIGTWMYYHPKTGKPEYLFVVNTSTHIYKPKKNIWIDNPLKKEPCQKAGATLTVQPIFSTPRLLLEEASPTPSYLDKTTFAADESLLIHQLGAGEGKIFKLSSP